MIRKCTRKCGQGCLTYTLVEVLGQLLPQDASMFQGLFYPMSASQVNAEQKKSNDNDCFDRENQEHRQVHNLLQQLGVGARHDTQIRDTDG